MAGRRLLSFRSGDLNEELGVLLLKGIAAVASIPRPEDFGIDAVANLLRQTPEGLLMAEDAFYVQFKSASARVIKYVDHEVRWLENLKLPFFIGSVVKEGSVIELYATHSLSQVLIEDTYKEIHLLLDGMANAKYEPQLRQVHIGPPLLSWSIRDLTEKDFPDYAYAILKPYLKVEQRNIDYRSIRYIDVISWETGKPPTFDQGSTLCQSVYSDSDIKEVFESLGPLLLAISNRAFLRDERHGFEILSKLIDYIRDSGVDLDPHDIFKSKLSQWEKMHASFKKPVK